MSHFIVNNFGKAENELKNATKEALNMIGLYVVGEAKKRCPVDTGYLRGQIKHRILESKCQIVVNCEYAVFVHEGTRFIPARRFITNAINENQDQIKKLSGLSFKNKLGGR